MVVLDHSSFKEALRKVNEEKYAQLERDIEIVRDFVEKGLTMFLESSSNMSRVNYGGIEM